MTAWIAAFVWAASVDLHLAASIAYQPPPNGSIATSHRSRRSRPPPRLLARTNRTEPIASLAATASPLLVGRTSLCGGACFQWLCRRPRTTLACRLTVGLSCAWHAFLLNCLLNDKRSTRHGEQTKTPAFSSLPGRDSTNRLATCLQSVATLVPRRPGFVRALVTRLSRSKRHGHDRVASAHSLSCCVGPASFVRHNALTLVLALAASPA